MKTNDSRGGALTIASVAASRVYHHQMEKDVTEPLERLLSETSLAAR